MASKDQTQQQIVTMMAANLPSLFGVSAEEMTSAQILATLGKLGGQTITEDALTFEGNKIILPERFKNDIPGAVRFLKTMDEKLNKVNDFYRVFKYRPYDVAHALSKAMKTIFGSTGVGKSIESFFGTTNPSYLTIDVGVNETARIITGRTAFSPLDATIDIGATSDDELGVLGYLNVSAPQRYETQVEGLFVAVEAELRERSIYRGKAITGAENPGFVDTSRVDPDKVIYTEEVMTQLRANIWTLLDHADVQRKMGLPLKRSVLMEGPYGSGKSLAAMLTAQRAIANGWTFVWVRPGDDLEAAMLTAQLYAPAVVFFEDVDAVAEKGDPHAVSKLLDMFDGIGSKGVEMIVVLTTNFPERIQKGMLRPGRMDAVIHVGEMDATGYERLIKAVVPEHLLLDINYKRIGKAFGGFLPAFAKEAIDRTVRYAIDRSNGVPDYLTTEDFENAARGMRDHLKLMEDASEGKRTPTLDAVFGKAIQGAMHSMEIVDTDRDFGGSYADYKVRAPKEQINS